MHERAREFVDRVAEAHGVDVEVQEFPEGTKTAAAAADAVGCETGQIASSLVFVAGDDSVPVVVVTSGANRVDEAALADHLDADDAAMADAETVTAATGWSIGGVPPLCHDGDPRLLFDPSLTDYDTVWAAAGTPRTVFPIDPERLLTLSGAEPAPVTSPK
ncbi:MAG: YbaK/EbsC family protein [Halolamina sp.]